MAIEKGPSEFQENFAADFSAKKAEVAEFLRTEAARSSAVGLEINEGRLDDNIRELALKMNRLPFLYTTQTCGGHVVTGESIRARHPHLDASLLQMPRAHTAFYEAGGIQFVLDGQEQGRQFIQRLKELMARFEAVALTEPAESAGLRLSEAPYDLAFGRSYGRQAIDLDMAKRLEAEKEEFKAELGVLVERFLAGQ